MIVRFSPRPEDLQRWQVGPIGPHMPSFAALVSQQGYCSVTGWLKVRLGEIEPLAAATSSPAQRVERGANRRVLAHLKRLARLVFPTIKSYHV